MTETVRWGILGAANFAANHMGPAIHEADGAVLAGLATSSPEKAARFQAFCPGLTVHDSYEALLASPEIDAVYIPLPNHMHVAWTKKAIAAGKAVLTEKPVAMKAGEIDGLIAARDAAGSLATEAYMIVHHPQWQRARDLVRGGAIGRLVHINAVFSFDNRAEPGNIRNKPDTGGGALPDIGVYTIGSSRFVTGLEPEGVRAQIDWDGGIDATTRMQASFGEASFNMLISMRMSKRQEVTFHGEAGQVRLTAPFNAGVFGEAQIEIVDAAGERLERFPDVRQYRLQVEAFGRSLREGVPFAWTLEDARGTQAAIDAAFASAGRPAPE